MSKGTILDASNFLAGCRQAEDCVLAGLKTRVFSYEAEGVAVREAELRKKRKDDMEDMDLQRNSSREGAGAGWTWEEMVLIKVDQGQSRLVKVSQSRRVKRGRSRLVKVSKVQSRAITCGQIRARKSEKLVSKISIFVPQSVCSRAQQFALLVS